MVRILSLSAAAAALAFAPASGANDQAETVSDTAEVTPVKLVEFNGGWEVLKTSSQLRVWRSHLGYTIAVDAEGKPTECEIEQEFRRAYVNKKLCSVLMKTHTFEPARDATDAPVPGSFTNQLSYLELREEN